MFSNVANNFMYLKLVIVDSKGDIMKKFLLSMMGKLWKGEMKN
jgi:hypothetical protein